ncbi:MAG: hypothetical protein RLZZ383_2121 [Pseudomonadota bacterium]|jgi:outer membrane protein TolC
MLAPMGIVWSCWAAWASPAAGELEAALLAVAATPEVALAASQADRAAADVLASRLDALPSLDVSAGYRRNQYEVTVAFPDGTGGTEEAVFTPLDQLDLSAGVSVALDVGRWLTIPTAALHAEAADARVDAATLQARRTLVGAWYRWAAASALVDAAAASRSAAERGWADAQALQGAGRATGSDVVTAEVLVARAVADEAAATRAESGAARSVARWTQRTWSVAPTLPEVPSVTPPLDAWEAGEGDVPSVEAASAEAAAASQAAASAWTVLLPTVRVGANERVTNAAGFGPSAFASASVTMDWSLGAAPAAALRARRADATAAAARLSQARLDAALERADAWDRLVAERARYHASAAEARAAELRWHEAEQQRSVGTATALAAAQAAQRHLAAQASAIAAQADAAAAEADLRLLLGWLR